MNKIAQYLSLVKFSHTIFALPFAMIGLFLGLRDQYSSMSTIPWATDGLWLILKVLLCMIFARSAAMAFNRYLDRRYDKLNPRTASREIPAGIIAPRHALAFTIVNCVAFVVTTWFINTSCLYLSFIALFVILFYSYTKRFTALCHLVLGLGLSLAPLGAYLAVTNHFALIPVLFSFVVLFWVSGFDIIYALQDEQFDKEQKLHSIPQAFGPFKALMISRLLHFISAALVIAIGKAGGFGWMYWIGAVLFCLLLIQQHRLVKPYDLSKVNMAFANANGLASILFAVCTIVSIFML